MFEIEAGSFLYIICGDGPCTASSSDPGIAVVIVRDAVMEIAGVAVGSAVITFVPLETNEEGRCEVSVVPHEA